MYKRFLAISGACILMILGSIAFLNIWHDPLFQYRDPFHGEAFESVDQYYGFRDATYQNPGMSKNFTFDTIITGSSMTQNFDSAYFDELMGVNALKLSLSGGNTKNVTSIVKVALENNPDVERIYTSLDYFTLSDNYLSEGNQPPEYLLNDNLFDDVDYIFNKDIFFQYTLNDIWYEKVYHSKNNARNDIFMWYGFPYGETKVLSQYYRSEISQETLAKDFYHLSAEQNLYTYWIPLITEYPDVQFNFFIPPYSMIYWDSLNRNGSLDAIISMWEHGSRILLGYENVSVHNFAAIEDITGNLWNYKDEAHYHCRVNNFMTECFADGSYQLTNENITESFDNLRNVTKEFDYEIFYSNPLRDINNFTAYTDALQKEDYLVLVAAGNTYMQNLSETDRSILSGFGIDGYDAGTNDYYVAVSSRDQKFSDTISAEKSLYTVKVGGIQIEFEELFSTYENLFSIQINGVEYSQNSSGVSFVVYDKTNQRVLDSVAFESEALVANRMGAWSDYPQYRDLFR